MLLHTLCRPRGLGMILVALVLTCALTACPNPQPTDNSNGGEPTPDNQNDNQNGNSNGSTDPAEDQDGDGVPDDIDQCLGTAPGSVVDPETGCPVVQPGVPDEDGDTVADDDDLCPDTPTGEQVDDDGCAASQRDDDQDGVADPDDDCPQTPAGEQVDDDGCAASQRDDDQDGVADPDDDCPKTPVGEEVDADGCSASQRDTDGDDVVDADDRCPGTPEGEQVDAHGCASSQSAVDTDGDGVPDPDDACPDTPEDSEVNAEGCAASQRDGDDDGVTDDVDQCPNTPAGERVDETGCLIGDHDDGNGGNGEPAVCGDGVVEGNEQCDPPDGVACDSNCQTIPGGGVPNDDCADAAVVVEGTISISNIDATTDGPYEPQMCDFFDYAHIESDIWYCYTATCTDMVGVSLCGSSFDTKLAVYAGCDCPTEGPLRCSDDNCGLGVESRVTVLADEGDSFLIRVGGFEGEQGEGYLTVLCGDMSPCGPGAGDCLDPDNGSRGCDDQACCRSVCEIDQYCCDVVWDDYCAGEAEGLCGGTFAACVNGTGDCETAHQTAGCDHERCCQTVCLNDPFCCLTEWDDVCAEDAGTRCAMYDVCAGATGSCFSEHLSPGCNIEDCCLLVCDRDPECCLTEWDDVCVDEAAACRE